MNTVRWMAGIAIVALAQISLATETPQATPATSEAPTTQDQKKVKRDPAKVAEAQKQLTEYKTELGALSARATVLTQEIGALALTGKAPADKETVDAMTKLVTELQQVNERLQQIEERIEAIEGFIEGLNESLPIITNDVLNLNRHRWGNYLQFQYQSTDRKETAINGSPADAFRVRRARIGITQTVDPKTTLRFSFDLVTGTGQTTPQLRDAFITYDIVPSDVVVGTSITGGQMPLPLGYELERSSAEREFPERARYNSTMFNGERSQGVLLRHGLGPKATLLLGGFNALTFSDAEQNGLQPGQGNQLAVLAGLRTYGQNYDAGIGFYKGKRPRFTQAVGNTFVSSPEIDREFLYLDATYVGLFLPQLFVRAEAMRGKDRVPNATAAANRVQVDMSGYQFQLGYNINYRNQVNLRYEQFDPNIDTSQNLFDGWGVSYLYWINPGARLTLAYENLVDRARSATLGRRFHQVTLRMQFRFP